MSAKDRPAMPYGWGRVPYAYPDYAPWMNLPFALEEYRRRIRRLAALMTRDGLGCVVVLGNPADSTNVRYLTNFEDFYGGETMVVVPADALRNSGLLDRGRTLRRGTPHGDRRREPRDRARSPRGLPS